jgi:hypothetical protein
MRTTLHIVTASAFNTWLAEHGYSGAETASVRTGGAVRSLAARDWTAYAPIGGTHTATKEGSQ